MSTIGRYLKPVCISIPRIGIYYLQWLGKYSKHPDDYPLDERYAKMRMGFQKITKDLNVDIVCEGLENVPKDINCCLIGNHIGDFDPLVIGDLIEQTTSYVGKIEIKDFPLIREGMAALSAQLMDRSDLKQSLKCMMTVQEEMKTIRKNWVIFPEGTRRKDSRLLIADFHPGTFRAPMKAGVPIVPFAIVGTDRIFHVKPCTFKRYPVHVKFLKPITKDEYEGMTTDDVAKLCHDKIQAAITFDLRPKDHKLMSSLYPKRYKML